MWLTPKQNSEFEIPYAGRVLRTHSGKTLIVDDDGTESWVKDSEVRIVKPLCVQAGSYPGNGFLFILFCCPGYQADARHVTADSSRYDNAGRPAGICHFAKFDCSIPPKANLRKCV